MLVWEQIPLRKGGLSFQGGRRGAESTTCGLIHPFRNLQAGEGRLAQPHRFAGSQICNPSYVAIGSESAQTRFERIQKVEGGLCSLGGKGFVVGGEARRKVGRQGCMVEMMDLSRGNPFRLRQP